MKSTAERRPRLALPFTILHETDRVHLIAGEDFRYTFDAPQLEDWLPDLLSRMNGVNTQTQLLASLDRSRRDAAREFIERLYGERIVSDGAAIEAHRQSGPGFRVEGAGPLVESLREETVAAPAITILCQDRLDFDQALQFNRRQLSGSEPWLWVNSGPMTRGMVSPVFLPDAGPCLACLIHHFQGLSPAPELYDALIRHSRLDRRIDPVPFPAIGISILKSLVLWKVSQMNRADPAASLYRLHVLELDSMEVTTHRVFVNPECPECREPSVG